MTRNLFSLTYYIHGGYEITDTFLTKCLPNQVLGKIKKKYIGSNLSVKYMDCKK